GGAPRFARRSGASGRARAGGLGARGGPLRPGPTGRRPGRVLAAGGRGESAVRRAKLAHVITELVVGGAVDNTLLSAAGMDHARWEVHVVGGPGGWVDRARGSSERVYVLPSLVRPIRPAVD